jgi:ubiquinol-cytochrome c reductase cytochrome c subunit
MRLVTSVFACLALVAGCGEMPLNKAGRDEAEAARPASWQSLYATHCAGCHGADGTLGPARPMRDAAYLASVPRAQLLQIVSGGQGTLMPALAQSRGGAVADADLVRLLDGMVAEWGKDGRAGAVAWSGPLGDAREGAAAYATFCQTCHGQPDGRAPGTRGSVTDPNYLRLVSDQALRSAIVFGRADLGGACAGPYPGQSADRRLSAGEVADITAFLAARRPRIGSTP